MEDLEDKEKIKVNTLELTYIEMQDFLKRCSRSTKKFREKSLN